jgi:hypothetical protein
VPKISRGSVGTLPITPLPTGATWAFEPFAFAPPLPSQEWPEGEYTIDNWEHFGGVLLSMLITDGRTAHVHGSAVMVAPGVAIAARHVIEEFLPNLTLATGGPSLSCVSINADQTVIWTCNTMTLVANDSDLIILMLAHASAMPKDNLFRLAMLTTRLPTVGERVLMVGFTASEDEIPESPSNVTVTGHVRVSTGIIKERYPTGRDLGMLPGPAVQVATSASGGMSGGPVFDQSGLLFGIVSTSYGHRRSCRTYVRFTHMASTHNSYYSDLAARRTYTRKTIARVRAIMLDRQTRHDSKKRRNRIYISNLGVRQPTINDRLRRNLAVGRGVDEGPLLINPAV